MTELEKYSLALVHSEEQLGGDHFKMCTMVEDVDTMDEQEIDDKTIDSLTEDEESSIPNI